MSDDESNSESRFDLEEPTSAFREDIVEFAKKIPVGPVTTLLMSPLGEELVVRLWVFGIHKTLVIIR